MMSLNRRSETWWEYWCINSLRPSSNHMEVMNHSTISNPKGYRPRQAPHHRHSSGVLASQHDAGHSRLCHPGRSRWDLPIVLHTCCTQSNEDASIFRDRPLLRKPQCPRRLFDHHTVGERGIEGKEKEMKYNEGEHNEKSWSGNKRVGIGEAQENKNMGE